MKGADGEVGVAKNALMRACMMGVVKGQIANWYVNVSCVMLYVGWCV